MPITITGNPVTRLVRSIAGFLRPGSPRPSSSTRLLVVVEGPNDIEFLRRISTILHGDDPSLPDLARMERELALVFVPSGGVDLSTAFRFASLGLPEFHLLDRDVPPATQARQQVAAMVNSRTRCCAAVTSKRSLENYLQADAAFEASGFRVAISDDENVEVKSSGVVSRFPTPPRPQATTPGYRARVPLRCLQHGNRNRSSRASGGCRCGRGRP